MKITPRRAFFLSVSIGAWLSIYINECTHSPKYQKPTSNETNDITCIQYLSNHQEIPGSLKLRELVCNDPRYRNGQDLEQALNTYRSVVDSLKWLSKSLKYLDFLIQYMQDLIATLHPLERKILPLLKNNITFEELLETSKMQEVEVMRALQWLENKEILKIKTDSKTIINLGELGKTYKKEKLPERRLLDQLKEKKLTLNEIKINKEELNIAIGELKKKAAINLGKEIEITDNGKKLLTKEFLEEKLLKT